MSFPPGGAGRLAAEALPRQRTDGVVTATLRSLQAGLRSPDSNWGSMGGWAAAIRLEVQASGEWKPFSVTVSDAVGGLDRRRCRVTPQGLLSPISLCRERAYRLRIEFSRVLTRGAAPEWTEVRDASVAVHRGRPVPGRAGLYVTGTSRGVYCRLSRAAAGWRYRVSDRARPTEFVAADYFDSSPAQYAELKLNPLRARVVVEGFRSRSLEWIVQPE